MPLAIERPILNMMVCPSHHVLFPTSYSFSGSTRGNGQSSLDRAISPIFNQQSQSIYSPFPLFRFSYDRPTSLKLCTLRSLLPMQHSPTILLVTDSQVRFTHPIRNGIANYMISGLMRWSREGLRRILMQLAFALLASLSSAWTEQANHRRLAIIRACIRSR
jgi:hypothetical protein